MRFKITESLDRLFEDANQYEINIYHSKDGKNYIFDGSKLIEMPKGGSLGKTIRSAEGWGKEEDEIGGSDKGEKGDTLTDGTPGEEGGEGEDGLNAEPERGGAGNAGDNSYDNLGFDDIDFDVSDEDLFDQMLDSETEKQRVELKNKKARLELEANPNGVVVSEIRTNIKQLISSQLEDKIEEYERWWTDKNAFTDDQARRLSREIDMDEFDKPLVQIYLDSSGSCSGSATVSIINQCASAFNEFVKEGLLDVEWYCFGTRVAPIEADSVGGASDSAVLSAKNAAGGSTNWEPLKNNIKETRPDNVVIVTDGDLSGQHGGEVIRIPGAIWCIFVNDMDKNMHNDFQGHPMKAWTVNVRGQKNNLKV